jgi:hypothetical protein
VPVQSRDPTQLRSLRAHLALAAGLSRPEVDVIRQLARQLDGVPVMPVLGAGASYDCGMRLARDVAKLMHADYVADASFQPRPSNYAEFETDLGAVADAIALSKNQAAAVTTLGLDDPVLWPAADDLTGHFCTYRVLARLAREDLFAEALTFNYDCGFEAGLKDEGFLFSPTTLRGRQWHDHATVIADAETNARLRPRGAFALVKAHGCAARYREAVSAGAPPHPEEAIVIRWSQLLDWRNDIWARDVLADRARRHVMLLLGFSGQDAVIHIALTRVLEDVYAEVDVDRPRIVVVGHSPDTLTLRMLASAGLAGHPPLPGHVTHVSTQSSSTTAVALVLLTELLALRLQRTLRTHGVAVPATVDARIAALALAAPAMLRWSFLLRRPVPWLDYAQRINLEQAAERGYVPLMADPQATALALRTRARLRSALGLGGEETVADALNDHGFIAAPRIGQAFLPVGLPAQTLLRAARTGELEHARRALERPTHLDCVLVAEYAGGMAGVSVETGATVGVP